MKIFICFLVFALCFTTNAFAIDCNTLQQKLANSTAQTITDESLLLRLSTTDGSNQPQQRELSIKRKVFTNLAEKMLIKILSPADLAGVAILAITSPKQKIAQWLYLPQTLETKRILGTQKKSRFAGSEFTFEDLVPFDFKHHTCENILTQDATHFTALLKPKTPTASYTTLTAQFEATQCQLQQIQFLNAQNQVVRTATFSDYRNDVAEQTRPFRITMSNAEHNRESTLEILKLSINTNLKDAEFNMQALTR